MSRSWVFLCQTVLLWLFWILNFRFYNWTFFFSYWSPLLVLYFLLVVIAFYILKFFQKCFFCQLMGADGETHSKALKSQNCELLWVPFSFICGSYSSSVLDFSDSYKSSSTSSVELPHLWGEEPNEDLQFWLSNVF